MKKLNYILMLMVTVAVFAACKDEPEYGSTYDIAWPRVVISGINPSEKADVSSTVSIKGSGLDKTMTVTIDNQNMTILEATEGELKVKTPRRFFSSPITITNLYRQTTVSQSQLKPQYPKVLINTFPIEIKKDAPIIFAGDNVDLITSVVIGPNNITVAASSSPQTTLSIATAGLGLKAGTKVVVEARSSFSTIENSKMEVTIVE